MAAMDVLAVSVESIEAKTDYNARQMLLLFRVQYYQPLHFTLTDNSYFLLVSIVSFF
jgi:hypothetical protein